jgi:hypothetical protein
MERVRRRSKQTIGQEPIQLPLFPESASLSRIRPHMRESLSSYFIAKSFEL